MAQAAAEGDEDVRLEIERATELLGIGIANMVSALHPDQIVLGGGVAQMGEILLETVRKTVVEQVKMVPLQNLEIKFSKLGDQAGGSGHMSYISYTLGDLRIYINSNREKKG